MGEMPAFESPVTGTYPPGAPAPHDPDRTDSGGPGLPLTLRDVSSTARVIVRGGAGSTVSRRLAAPFGTSRTEGGVLIGGIRPDEWTLVGPAAAVAALVGGLDRSGHTSVIEGTHGTALFRLTGDGAASVLEKLCSLDWDDAMTPDGAAVSASVARVTCDIVHHDLDGARSYLISCDRSYGQYLFDTILDAGREFGIRPSVGRAG